MKKLELLRKAKQAIDNKRYIAEDKSATQLQFMRANYLRFAEVERNYKMAQVNYVMASNDKEKDSAKIALDRNKEEYISFLTAYGLDENALKPHYFCTSCNDTGYINNHICSCLQNEINKLIAVESSVGNKAFTFANSTETNEHNISVYEKARQSILNGQSILLTGSTGTGKTYLLNACCNLSVSEHRSTQLLTAYDLNSLFLECHLSDLATQQAILDSFVDVDVLAIDDLGTETVYKNVSAQYLFMIINERVNRNKPTFVTTNLDLRQLRERYDERIFSRLLDVKSTFVAKLEGSDKRLISNS